MMEVYSRECVLLLTIAVCGKWTNPVAGQDTREQAPEQEIQETTDQPDLSKLLPSVMQGLTAVTKKPLVLLFDVPLDEVNDRIRSLQDSYSGSCKISGANAGTEAVCTLVDNNTLTLRTITEKLQHVYLSVHQGSKPTDTTVSDIDRYCSTQQPDMCPICPKTTTCPTLNSTTTKCPSPNCPTPKTCPTITCPTTTCPPTKTCPTTACPITKCPSTTKCPLVTCPITTCPPPKTCPITTCPITTCPSPKTSPTMTCPTTTCPTPTYPTTKRTLLSSCKSTFNQCHNERTRQMCTYCKYICDDKTTSTPGTTNGDTTPNNNNKGSPCDSTGLDSQQQTGDDTLPVVIASVVSFFAGVVVCLLALCLIRCLRERLCLKPIASPYVATTEKSRNEAMKPHMLTTIDMTEHEYLDLQCDQVVNSDMSTFGQTQSNNKIPQAPEYETMSDIQKDNVYSGIRNSGLDPSTVYEHSSPNRSSEHVYSGILNETRPNDTTTRQPTSSVNMAGGISSYTNVTYDNRIPDKPDEQTEPSDYFIPENNQQKHESGRGTDECSILGTAGEHVEPNTYHILENQEAGQVANDRSLDDTNDN